MSKDTIIEIRDFNFYFAERHVIKNLNLDIQANKITAVFGPANSGVTTLLRSLNRLSELNDEVKTSGKIMLNGEDILGSKYSITQLRRRVGMVFEVPTPLPMSVYDNVCFGPLMSGVKNKKELAKTVEESLRMAALWDDVKDRLDAPATSLSGGQQQRLCIARVIALHPQVIMLDRACSGLDPISTAKIEESLRKLKEQYTIIIAPHNIKQAARVSDRTIFLLMGELIEEGPTNRIFNYPKDQRTHDYITGRFG